MSKDTYGTGVLEDGRCGVKPDGDSDNVSRISILWSMLASRYELRKVQLDMLGRMYSRYDLAIEVYVANIEMRIHFHDS
tara:strand:- start:18622 stop:18858 length:237 start_codon:yes stop_codon:yes gene_type:complete